MSAALIDSTIFLRLITAQIETAVNLPYVAHLGEKPHAAGGVQIRVVGFRIDRDPRNIQDLQPDAGTFELTIEIVVDELNMTAAIDNITKVSMLAVAALDEQRLYDADTQHEVQCLRASEEVGTGEEEDRIIGVSMVTVVGMVKRQAGATVAQRSE